jgi:hypothetical protein
LGVAFISLRDNLDLTTPSALQQLTAFAGGGTMPAELETAALDLDFSAGAEEESAGTGPRSNSRSKTFQIN